MRLPAFFMLERNMNRPKPRVRRILCPVTGNHTHLDKGGNRVPHDKILLIYHEEEGRPPKRLWIHCGDPKCNCWIQVKFNSTGGVSTKRMPEGVRFHADAVPVLHEEPA